MSALGLDGVKAQTAPFEGSVSAAPRLTYDQQLEQNMQVNAKYAKPGPYITPLNPAQQSQFEGWLKANNVNYNATSKNHAYDMPGYWLSMQGPNGQKTQVNPFDHKLHYPDTYKTPYDRTFSNESKYANESAPHWVNNQYLVEPNGKVVFNQATQSEDDYYGKPAGPLTQSLMSSTEAKVPISPVQTARVSAPKVTK